MKDDQLLTSGEACEYLGTSSRYLENLRYRGDGPPYIRLGRTTVRYRRDELDAWLDARTYRSTAEESAAATTDGGAR